MATSDYETKMVDSHGNYVRDFPSPCGVVVQVYKTVLHVSDRKAWRKKSGFTNGLVMCVTDGRLDYQDVSLVARRGPQGGIYAAVWRRVGFSTVGVVGYGVPEHVWRGRSTGITQRSLNWFGKSIHDESLFPDVPDFLREATVFLTPTFIKVTWVRRTEPEGQDHAEK